MSSLAPAGVVVREARIADAEALARCQLACWAETYTGMVDPVRLARALAAVDERIERWRSFVTQAPPRLVADDEGAVVGFAAVGPPREPVAELTTELYALYVRRSHWDTGLGHRLLEAAIGTDDCCLWVFQDNTRARRFYGRHGFVPDGTESWEDHFGGAELRMVRVSGSASVEPRGA